MTVTRFVGSLITPSFNYAVKPNFTKQHMKIRQRGRQINTYLKEQRNKPIDPNVPYGFE